MASFVYNYGDFRGDPEQLLRDYFDAMLSMANWGARRLMFRIPCAFIDTILQRGYTPHIDDGVLINMPPLWELIPSWRAEPKKCWEALVRGDYAWAHQAMDHWPDRVRDKCKTNRSYVIAHGLA